MSVCSLAFVGASLVGTAMVLDDGRRQAAHELISTIMCCEKISARGPQGFLEDLGYYECLQPCFRRCSTLDRRQAAHELISTIMCCEQISVRCPKGFLEDPGSYKTC